MAAMADHGQQDGAVALVLRADTIISLAVCALLTYLFLVPTSEVIVGGPAHGGLADCGCEGNNCGFRLPYLLTPD